MRNVFLRMQRNIQIISQKLVLLDTEDRIRVLRFDASNVISVCTLQSRPTEVETKDSHNLLVCLSDGRVAVAEIPRTGSNFEISVDSLLRCIGCIPKDFGRVSAIAETSCFGSACILGDRGCLPIKNLELGSPIYWDSATSAVRTFVTLAKGAVHTAVCGRTFDGPVHVTGNGSGLILVTVGGKLPNAFVRKDRRILFNLFQPVVASAGTYNNVLLVFVGSLGSGVVLWAKESRTLCTTRISLQTDGRSLRAKDVLFRLVQDGDALRVINARDGFCTTVRLAVDENDKNPLISVSRGHLGESGCVVTREQPCYKDFRSETLRSLLRGIDVAAERRTNVLRRAAVLDSSLSSFHAAILFGLAWKRALSGGGDSSIDISCSLSGSCISSIARRRNLESTDWYGSLATIRIVLKNRIGIDMNDGWILRVYTRQEPQFQKSTVLGLSSDADNVLPTTQTSTLPVGNLKHMADSTHEIPITLSSHGPIVVSVVLVFLRQFPSVASFANIVEPQKERVCADRVVPTNKRFSLSVRLSPAEKLLRIPLRREVPLDVIDFANCVSDFDELQDGSHKNLRTSRISRFVDPFNKLELTPPQRSVAQLYLPIGTRFLWNICRGEELSQKIQTDSDGILSLQGISALGSPFSCEFRRNGTGMGTFIVIRAACHVLPFIRAAILRRAIKLTDEIDIVFNKVIANTFTGRTWVLDELDVAFKDLRDAQRNVVDMKTWICEKEESGWLDAVLGGQDRITSLQAVASLGSSFEKWRNAFADVFTGNNA